MAKLERLFGHFSLLKALINRQLFGQFWSGSVCQSANKQLLFALVYSWVPDTKSHPCHTKYCQCFSQKGDIIIRLEVISRTNAQALFWYGAL